MSASAPSSSQDDDTFADKLNRLFAVMPRPGQGEYSPEEVAREIVVRGGNISPAYIYMLRKGQRDNPTKKHIEALADFFHVPVSYFFDEGQGRDWDEQLALVAAVKDDAIRLIAQRAAGLSPAALDAVLRIVEVARGVEHLPECEP